MSFCRKAALLCAAFLFPGLFLGACSRPPWLSPYESAMDIGSAAGFLLGKEVSSGFSITTFLSKGVEGDTLTVYIEGDGARWVSSSRPPADPTPTNPVSLMMAGKDVRRPVLYIGRPCQYLDRVALTGCDSRYWTESRFSLQVIDAMDGLVSRVKLSEGARRVRLIGFSGGGVVAALLAARRGDIDSLVTVAAPLDIEEWSDFHQISPLRGSLNPMHYLRQLSHIRQTHFFGEKDDVVPVDYAKALQSKMKFARFVFVPGYTHSCCWVENWSDLLSKEQ